MSVTAVILEVSNEVRDVPMRKPPSMEMTDANPDALNDVSERTSWMKPSPMITSDVNPDVSKDASDGHSKRKNSPMDVTFGAWIEQDTKCLQPRRTSLQIVVIFGA